MTAEIWSEYCIVMPLAWVSFFLGIGLWYWRDVANFYGLQHASKLLLFASLMLLSAFGYRSTKAVQTVEMLVYQPRAKSVFDEAPRLVAEYDTVTTPGGFTFELARTRTVSGATATRSVQRASECDGRVGSPTGRGLEETGTPDTGLLAVQTWRQLSGSNNNHNSKPSPRY